MTVLDLLQRLQELAESGQGDARVAVFSEDDCDLGDVDVVEYDGLKDLTGRPYVKLIVPNEE